MSNRWGIGAVGAAVAAGLAATAQAQVVFQLQDHPAGNQAPPTYGLRFDNLFTSIGGPGGFTTFSFNEFDDVTLTVGAGPNPSITIAGTVYGGVDAGSDYGFGEGAYALTFTYAANVSPSGTGWTAAGSPLNTGSLTALGDNNGVPLGTAFSLGDMNDITGSSFLFLQDGHRLTPEEIQGLGDPWVGRGWLTSPNSGPGTHDWIFLGTLIPAPSAGILVALGVAAAARRRR